MIERVLEEKIAQYDPANALDQENVLAELLQHYVLAGLSRAGFFRVAEFHGGTYLRIIHGLDRFSEDLDFVLKEPNPDFAWDEYLKPLVRSLDNEGLSFEVSDRRATSAAVHKAFLKTDSIGNVLEIELPHTRDPRRKIRIKLEIDTNPPAGSSFETSYLNFPVLSAITAQTLESAFASKCHALLCRSYTKGRDWYDFLWYVARAIRPNFELLQNAICQVGPWAGQSVEVTPTWCLEQLRVVVAENDWEDAAQDVRRFLNLDAQQTLALWSRELFEHQLSVLGRSLM